MRKKEPCHSRRIKSSNGSQNPRQQNSVSVANMAMNTREIIEAATELKLWQPTGAKTPEQTLYGAIVRENKTKEHPRIVKSNIKGKFIYAGE